MLSKQWISLGLILSQLFVAAPGFCGTEAPSANSTPEAKLLIQMIAFQADGVATEAWKKEANEALERYAETAPTTGREERLEQAMVSMGMYSAPQAAEIMATAQAAEARLSSLNDPTQTGAQKATEFELIQILHTTAQGAEFSSCARDAGRIEAIGAGVLVIGLLGSLAQGYHNPSNNWATITAISGFGLAVVGVAIGYGC